MPMKVLVAEDDLDIALSYKLALEERNHRVVITDNGEECLVTYNDELQRYIFESKVVNSTLPFDAVILDFKIPNINGLEVAKEILAVNPHQRIIFASAYVKEFLSESVRHLSREVELMQKPFDEEALIYTLEDKEIYEQLANLEVDINAIKLASPSHEQIKNLLISLKRLQKLTRLEI